MHQDPQHRNSERPSPTLPVKGRVLGRLTWLDYVTNSMRHLPLDGGGWEGVTW